MRSPCYLSATFSILLSLLFIVVSLLLLELNKSLLWDYFSWDEGKRENIVHMLTWRCYDLVLNTLVLSVVSLFMYFKVFAESSHPRALSVLPPQTCPVWFWYTYIFFLISELHLPQKKIFKANEVFFTVSPTGLVLSLVSFWQFSWKTSVATSRLDWHWNLISDFPFAVLSLHQTDSREFTSRTCLIIAGRELKTLWILHLTSGGFSG